MNIVCIRHHLVFRILTMLQRPTIWNLQIKTTQKCTQLNFATPKAMNTKILFDLPRYFTFHSYLPCANKILHSFCNAFALGSIFFALLSLSPSSSMCTLLVKKTWDTILKIYNTFLLSLYICILMAKVSIGFKSIVAWVNGLNWIFRQRKQNEN